MTLNAEPAVAPPYVILIDDDTAIHALVAAMLRSSGVRLDVASDGEHGLALARVEPPHLILLDNEMPGATGLEILTRLKAELALADIPVIMETGSEGNSVLTACFAAGAVDYVRKPFTAAELRARVGSVLERQRMVGELTAAARLDKLTGLSNRALLSERMSRALERAHGDTEYDFAVMFLDFDRFKLVNDTLGHDIGDLLLKGIANRLRANLRSSDSTAREALGNTVARLGGDEFVVVLDGVGTVEVATIIADRLLGVLAAPYQLGEHVVRSTASIGIVTSASGYGNANDMLRDADIAMYEAKARGKGCHVIFSQAMRDSVHERMTLETDLRAAIGTSEFSLAYQPIVSLETRATIGVEALARWTHPTRGNITPDVFIPIAEETGIIVTLSDQLLIEACAAFVGWQRDQPTCAPEYISVNLSRVQLLDPLLVDRTMAVVAEAGMLPSQLQLEVTESQIMQQRSNGIPVLARFQSLGVRIAMDDFGTGYSSLSCLQEFPLDVLKVDRSFVANAGQGRDFAALLHAVVTLADNLGLTVVAEGIETEDQLVLLQALGCAGGQGYLLARPMPLAQFAEFLESSAAALHGR